MLAVRKVVVSGKLGLHARRAARFAQAASGFVATIRVGREGDAADGKSLMSLLRLAAPSGTALTITAEGPDAEAAVDALARLIEQDREDERCGG